MTEKITVETEIEVAFSDLDPLEVVWHGNYWHYFEKARAELFRALDYDYPKMRASNYSWPVVHCSCRYYKPLKYGMKAKVRATVAEYELMLKINYLMSDSASGEKLCAGETSQVAVDMTSGETCLGSPPVFLKRVRAILDGA